MHLLRSKRSRPFVILVVLSGLCALANPLLDVFGNHDRAPRVALSIAQFAFLLLSAAVFIALRPKNGRPGEPR